MATQELTRKRRRTWLGEAWESNVGKKVIVAITGFVLVAYVILHMVGNLTALQGPGGGDARIDDYAHWLREFGTPLLPYAFVIWVIRVVLLASFVVHIVGVTQLWKRSNAARPAGHPAKRIRRTWTARTMRITGPLLLFFVIFHILQFTTLTIDVTPLRHGELYANLYNAFQKWYFVLLYVAAVSALMFHLHHGVWSALQTLGADRPARNRALRATSAAVAGLVWLGFVLIPLLFWTGALAEPIDAATHAQLLTEVAR
ncbi:succinate dehydrogenase cytochrome b subunit [Patulibacter sp. S7RM1-6]